MVSRDKGVPVTAMSPKVQMSAMATEPAGIRMPRRFRKNRKRIRATRKKVTGGRRRKSCSVKSANAFETMGMPIW